jgi:hypothetical protein
MGRMICGTNISFRGAMVGIVFALLALTICCRPGNKWTEVQSFTTDKGTISAGHRFKLEPVDEGKGLIRNIGVFEATFNCTRLEGQDEVSYKTASHFKSRASGKGKMAMDQTLTSLGESRWPAGASTQKVNITCPFFPWEVKSTKEGYVYFYMQDAQDGTMLSNIIVIPVKIRAR